MITSIASMTGLSDGGKRFTYWPKVSASSRVEITTANLFLLAKFVSEADHFDLWKPKLLNFLVPFGLSRWSIILEFLIFLKERKTYRNNTHRWCFDTSTQNLTENEKWLMYSYSPWWPRAWYISPDLVSQTTASPDFEPLTIAAPSWRNSTEITLSSTIGSLKLRIWLWFDSLYRSRPSLRLCVTIVRPSGDNAELPLMIC